jgi:tRNA pseudouridine55 synthase
VNDGAVSPRDDRPPAPDGLVIVDKPAGWTSHDVVARLRRLARTRRVGHAGTLDPMATGVLVIGVGSATRLLHHLVLADKAYEATVRLGQSTLTDDAEGERTGGASAAGTDEQAVRAALGPLTGDILQVPSSVSAIKIDGQRAYKRVRDGESPNLPARPVTVSRLDALGFTRPAADLLDVDVRVECSSGTYVRALARDLGASLGSAGHLLSLRRTRVGPYGIERAHTLEVLDETFSILSIADAARAAFATRDLSAEEARRLAHGQRLDASELGPGPVAAYAPDGSLVALIADAGLTARPLVVLTG